MPSLTATDRKKMLGRMEEHICRTCRKPVYKNYCREHDVFYMICGCAPEDSDNHKGHRTYQCQMESKNGQCPQPMECHCPKCDKYICWPCAMSRHDCDVRVHHLDPSAYTGVGGERDDGSGDCHCSLMR